MGTAGEEAGRDWITSQAAEVAELENLARWYKRVQDPDAFFVEDDREEYSLAERVYFQIHPWDDQDRSEAQEFWEGIFHGHEYTAGGPVAIRGFVEGALDLWSELERQL